MEGSGGGRGADGNDSGPACSMEVELYDVIVPDLELIYSAENVHRFLCAYCYMPVSAFDLPLSLDLLPF